MRKRLAKLTILTAAFGAMTLGRAGAAEAGRGLVHAAQSWTYQLRGADRAAASGSDIVVVDANSSGSLSRLQHKPGGGRRAALAYLSIGEAETWRPYWKSCCSNGKHPAWLTGSTQGWSGNYVVRYWDPAWRNIVLARVQQIMKAGFDGLYLDRVDTWEHFKGDGKARAEMIRLVRDAAAAARAIKPDAAILVQNGEELLSDGGYLAAIDGIAKESLLYGVAGPGRRNSDGDIRASLAPLKRAKAAGKTVLVVEYIGGSAASGAAGEIRRHGFVPTFAERGL